MDKEQQVLTVGSVAGGPKTPALLDEKGFERVSFIEGGLVGWPFELRSGISTMRP